VPYIMPPERSIDIDMPNDLKMAAVLLKENVAL
jgi:CMP-N-acetylneuraminic acid synthetase